MKKQCSPYRQLINKLPKKVRLTFASLSELKTSRSPSTKTPWSCIIIRNRRNGLSAKVRSGRTPIAKLSQDMLAQNSIHFINVVAVFAKLFFDGLGFVLDPDFEFCV